MFVKFSLSLFKKLLHSLKNYASHLERSLMLEKFRPYFAMRPLKNLHACLYKSILFMIKEKNVLYIFYTIQMYTLSI